MTEAPPVMADESVDLTDTAASAILKTENSWPEIAGFDMREAQYLLAGDLAFFKELLAPFLEDHANTVAEVRALIDAGNTQQASKRVHRLRGEAANLGATTLKTAAAALEKGLNHAATDIDIKFSDFEHAHFEVFTAAREWLGND